MSVLQKLLNQGIGFDPHYLPSMNSDHLPMTLCAMAGLGARDDQLQAYRDDYARILRPVVAGDVVTAWQQGLGNPKAYASLLQYFGAEIGQKGRMAVVAEVFPEVLSGIAMGAFHPLIRLAYALDFESDAEAAAALAYLVVSQVDLPTSAHPIDLATTFANQVGQQPVRFSSQRFAKSIVELAVHGVYPNGHASIEDCAKMSLTIYRATRNFFALHMVTATQAMRVCLARLREDGCNTDSGLTDHAEAALTASLLAAHLVVGAPAFAEPAPMPRQIDREHGYKYAWVCKSEHRHYGHEVYQQELQDMVAAGLVEPWVL